MLKKISIIFVIIFNLFALYYLLSPTPSITELTNSLRSTEPGDTVQIKNVKGYFTNQNRSQIMNFYYQSYKHLFVIRLNHPPEKARTILRDPIQSYYLEELVIPFKESLFINGFEWENDVFTKPDQREANKILVGNQLYKTKVTIRTFPTTIPKRLISFYITEFAVIFIAYAFANAFIKKRS